MQSNLEFTAAEKIRLKEEVNALSQEVRKIDSRILVHSEVKMEMLRPPLVPWLPSLLNRTKKTKASPLKEEKKRPPKKIKTSLDSSTSKKNDKKKNLTPTPEPSRVSPRPRSVSPRPSTRRSGGSFSSESSTASNTSKQNLKTSQQNSKGAKSLPSKHPPAPKITYNPVLPAPEWKRRRIQHKYDSDELLEFCHRILNELMQHENSWPFLQPVDYKALQIPDYPEIIKNPMDLGTIKQKLQDGQYTHFKNFVDDIALVWSNCMTYNGPHLEVHQMAKELSLIFNTQMRPRKRLVEQNVPLLQTAYHRRALEQLKVLHSKLKKQQQSLQPKQKREQVPKVKTPKPRKPKQKTPKKESEGGSSGGPNKKKSGGSAVSSSGGGSLNTSLSGSTPGVQKIVHHNPNGSSSTTTSATSDSSSDDRSDSEDKKPKKHGAVKNGEGRAHIKTSFNQSKSQSGEGGDVGKWNEFRNSNRKSISSSRDKSADASGAKKTPEELRREELRRTQLERKRNDEARANYVSRTLGHSGDMMPNFNMPLYGMNIPGYGMNIPGMGLGMGMNMGMAPPGMVPTGMENMGMHMGMGPGGMHHQMMGIPPGIQSMINSGNRMPPPTHGGVIQGGVRGSGGGVVVPTGTGVVGAGGTRPPPPIVRTQPPPVAAVIK